MSKAAVVMLISSERRDHASVGRALKQMREAAALKQTRVPVDEIARAGDAVCHDDLHRAALFRPREGRVSCAA